MTKKYLKFIAGVLILLMIMGLVVPVAADLISCTSKSCCCKMAHQTSMMDHQEKMEVPQKCDPKTPAPCCRIEPFQQKTVLAITLSPNTAPNRIFLTLDYKAVENTTKSAQQIYLNNKLLLDGGPSKIPHVPIYLQTLSILC